VRLDRGEEACPAQGRLWTPRRARGRAGLWITEVNWPLAGTGAFSPAAGKPNVGEDEQAVSRPLLCSLPGLGPRRTGLLVAARRARLRPRGRRESPGGSARPSAPSRSSAAASRGAFSKGAGRTGRTYASRRRGLRFRREGGAFAICWSARRTAELMSPRRSPPYWTAKAARSPARPRRLQDRRRREPKYVSEE
jgi:hypothetical protein